MGGVLVPWSLLKTMRACLSREQSQRPTCQDLLSEADPFLYPQEHASALRDAPAHHRGAAGLHHPERHQEVPRAHADRRRGRIDLAGRLLGEREEDRRG